MATAPRDRNRTFPTAQKGVLDAAALVRRGEVRAAGSRISALCERCVRDDGKRCAKFGDTIHIDLVRRAGLRDLDIVSPNARSFGMAIDGKGRHLLSRSKMYLPEAEVSVQLSLCWKPLLVGIRQSYYIGPVCWIIPVVRPSLKKPL